MQNIHVKMSDFHLKKKKCLYIDKIGIIVYNMDNCFGKSL